jgi:hypothetical protein
MVQTIITLLLLTAVLFLLMILFVGGVGPEVLKALAATAKMEMRD